MRNKLQKILLNEGLFNYLKRKYYTKIKPIKGRVVESLFFEGKKIKILLDAKNGYVDKYIYESGVYEKLVLKRVVKHLGSNDTVFDIGANIGQHSLIFSKFAKEVYSFEPNSSVFYQFLESVRLNKIDNIIAENCGIGATNEFKKIYVNPQNAGNSSVLPNENYKSFTIKIKNLKEYEDALDKVDFVKIDVEGFELDIIIGNISFFRKFQPTIWFEFNLNEYLENSNYNIGQLDDLIRENNYKIYSYKKNTIIKDLSTHLLTYDNIILAKNINF